MVSDIGVCVSRSKLDKNLVYIQLIDVVLVRGVVVSQRN